MFEARFQTFDDASERAESAARVAALRAELKRRGLDGFVVPRADRQQNEYLPASEERLAWLTGFTGSAGAARRAEGQGRGVRRRPLHRAGRRAGRQSGVRHRASGRDAAEPVAGEERQGRRQDRLRSVAAHERGRREAAAGLHGRRRRARRRRRTIRSTRCGATGRRRRPERSRCATSSSPARAPPTSSSACAPSWRKRRRTRSSSPIRRTSPGPSTSAAPTSRIRRWRSPSR